MYYPDKDLKNIHNKVHTILSDLRDADGGGSGAAYAYYVSLENLFKKVDDRLGEINHNRMRDTDKEQKQRIELGLEEPIEDSPSEFSHLDR
jgi:hypothetical protein